jgi:Domain of unknown function (DUF4388)
MAANTTTCLLRGEVMIPQVIAGTFTRDSLPDLLRSVAGRGESGQLTLTSRSLRAIVHFEHGTLIGARFGTNAGEEAFMRILALEAGTCNFEAGRASAVTIDRPLEHLLASAYVSERLTQEPVPITERTVLSSREAEASKPVNLMRIHWQVIKHVDGERNLGQISELIGLSVQQLERPVRDLTVAGLIGVNNDVMNDVTTGQIGSSAAIEEAKIEPVGKTTNSETETEAQTVSSTSERKRTLFGGLFSKATHDTNSGDGHRSKPFTLERLLPPQKAESKAESKPETLEAQRSNAASRTTSAGTASGATSRRIDISGAYIDPEFLGFVQKRLTSFIGPMAEFALLDAAESLGTSLEKVRVEKLEVFIELLIQEVPTERQADFHAQVGPLVQRYTSRINR